MTIDEAGAIMDVLKVAYPRFYINQTEDEKYDASKLWTTMFADDDAPLVVAAVKSFIATDIKGYPPHIGAIKNEIQKITTPAEMSELEAWNIVKKAVTNSLYNAKDEYEKLPPMIKRICGSPSTLREWAAIDFDELNTVVSSNFQRSYRAVSKAERDYAMVPSDVKQIMSELTKRMDLDAKQQDLLPKAPEPVKNDIAMIPQETLKSAEYKPISAEEWNIKRNELMARLQGA